MSPPQKHPRPQRSATVALATTLFVACATDQTPQGAGDTETDTDLPDQPAPSDSSDPTPTPSASGDIGRLPLHRLTRAEYEHTLRDLLNIEDLPPATFIRGGTGVGFPNEAKLLRDVSEDLARGYIEHARNVTELALATPHLRDTLLACEPSSTEDTSCARPLLDTFGARAWRRPLDTEETTRLEGHYLAIRREGASHEEAVAVLIRMFLSSPHFVFHIELDDAPEDATPHRLNPYELAARLSYTLWSSLPDDELWARATDGSILDHEVMRDEVTRMLDDPRGLRFREAFLETWVRLPLLDAQAQLIDTSVYPAWSAELGHDMRLELQAYLDAFLETDRPWSTFLTADLNFVTPRLAAHYGIPWTSDEATLVQVDEHPDARIGYLGLAGFLTYSSRATRTAPTFRGKIILEALNCMTLQIPADIPELELEPEGGEPAPSIREQLERHRASPECAGCHDFLDPIGFSLENFDAIGAWRETYDDGHVIDASTEYLGTQVSSLVELAPLVAASETFLTCPIEKMMTYALRRTPTSDDRAFIREIRERWNGGSIRDLAEAIVLHDAFQWRRGETAEEGDRQ